MFPMEKIPDIHELWTAPFALSFEDLVLVTKCLTQDEQDKLLKLKKLYVSEEALNRKNSQEFYHTHGVLSAEVIMFTMKENKLYDNLDCFFLTAAALLHDFNGFVSKDKKFAEAIDLLESKGLVALLGKPALDKIENLLQYTSYDVTKPINWGNSLLEGDQSEVMIADNVPLEGLLVSYGDIIGQLCSPNYLERAKELLKVLDISDTDFIPLKLLVLADKIVIALKDKVKFKIPAEIKNSLLLNTTKVRNRYNYSFSFE